MTARVVFVRDREDAREAVRRLSLRLGSHDDAEAWYALGAEFIRLGDRAGAFAAFRNALRLDGTHINSQLALGNLLFDSGQCERALRCFGMVEGAR